jgi:surfactin synthase thioesterase subunit
MTRANGNAVEYIRLRGASQERWRLVCFPHAGGNANSYFNWSEELHGDGSLFAVQLPGRDMAAPFSIPSTFEPWIDRVAQDLSQLVSDRCVFFGHSLGAILAFEVTRALRRQGRSTPIHLFVSGRAAPHLYTEDRILASLPDRAFLERVSVLYGGIPASLLAEPDIMRMFLPILRGDFVLANQYEFAPGPLLDIPITAYGGAHDPCVSTAQLDGWREHTSSSFSLRVFPGDHFYLHDRKAQVVQDLWRDGIAHLGSDLPATPSCA